VCCSVEQCLERITVFFSVGQCGFVWGCWNRIVAMSLAVCCCVLQCVAVCCGVLQCVAVRGSVKQCEVV